MYGQFSQGSCRRTKQDMLAAVTRPITRSRKAGNNRLHVVYADGGQAFILHNTIVAEMPADKATLTLNDGGWATRTTRRAMEDAAAAFHIPLRVWADKGWHVVNGQRFDRSATFRLPGLAMVDAAPEDIMVRAVVNGETSLEVRFTGNEIVSSNGEKISATPFRVAFELNRMLDLARRHRGFVGFNPRYGEHIDYSESLPVFHGAWAVHAGRFGRSVHVGCHEFKTVDIRAALRRLETSYPEQAKRGRKMFLTAQRRAKAAPKVPA